MIREYIWLEGRMVGMLSSQYPGQLLRVHTDHLGTVRAVSQPNTANTVVWRWEGDQFGDVLPTGNLIMPLRHPGQYYDAEVGTFYNYFRDYDPATGRYLQSDPIGLDGGLNTYGYVGGSPTSFIDSEGLKCTRRTLFEVPLASHRFMSQLISQSWSLDIHTEPLPFLSPKMLGSIKGGALNTAKGGYITTCFALKTSIYKEYYQKAKRVFYLDLCEDCDDTNSSLGYYDTTTLDIVTRTKREKQKYSTGLRTWFPEVDCIKWFNRINNL